MNLNELRPYGDTMNDGKVQISFTLPVKNDDKGAAAAKELAIGMGVLIPEIAARISLDKDFTFYVIYGSISKSVDYSRIKVSDSEEEKMSMEEIDALIRKEVKRKLIVIGASTGTDAHTVGIDAILNRKGFAGHYGLERYEMFETHNLGSQVTNEDFVSSAKKLKADILLVSQTVTQKDVHVKNLIELIELLEAENHRNKVILICGGARITNELAKELGYDAGFGAGKFADDLAVYAVKEFIKRKSL
ncbi:MAG: cobalamin-dependent protein [Treponema sp.]|nr:cobalamin-dependent protein [Treponema sp.]